MFGYRSPHTLGIVLLINFRSSRHLVIGPTNQFPTMRTLAVMSVALDLGLPSPFPPRLDKGGEDDARGGDGVVGGGNGTARVDSGARLLV